MILAATEFLTADSAGRTHYWHLFDHYERQLKQWADRCPENYLHKYCLVKGERARLELGSLDEVLAWFDKAIESARKHNFPNGLAIAHELKGRFWLTRHQKSYAMMDLKEAHYRYHLWGATGKVAMLEEEFAELSLEQGRRSLLTPVHLDFLSVHKAARAISGKIEAHALVQTMMTIVVESAGADRGALLLEKNGKWQIEACADVSSQGIEICFPDNHQSKAEYMPDVPSSVVNYVLRTQTLLSINEPIRDLRFGQDAYIIRVVPRSVLCVPVINQERTTGILYLENKLGPDVFSSDRRDLIDVLAGQIAISLENATLYADLKSTVAQLSEQTVELRTRNEEINVVSLQRKMAEEETRRLNAELELRVEDRTADLRRSNEELEQFAYVASHDLQEPLRKVGSFAQLLAAQYKGKLDADADEFIGYMVDGARRMQTLIQNLLAYSRLGRKGQPFAPTDVNAVLNESLANLQMTIDESGAAVKSALLPTVLGDAVQLVQLFQNLIGNAIKFRGPGKPLIHIRVEATGPSWTFSVRDNGIGIDSQFAKRIFVIFQRLHRREEYPGTGIGLAFCKKIVERHGGLIWMESQPGQGTTFFFTIPRTGNNEQRTHEHDNEL